MAVILRKSPQTKLLRKTWPRIYSLNGGGTFMVDLRRRGAGSRRCFKTLAEAKTQADAAATERDDHGVTMLNVSPKDRMLMLDAMERLRSVNATVNQAVDFYLQHLEAQESPTISAAVADYMIARELDMKRGDLARTSFNGIRRFMDRVGATLGELRVTNLDEHTIRQFLDSHQHCSARTRDNLLRMLSRFLTHCRMRRWVTVNPCSLVKVKVPRTDVKILSVDECEMLLRCAETSKHSEVWVPYVSLGLFLGCRPYEVLGMDWSQVNDDHVEILPHTTKVRDRRFVPMNETAAVWLKPYRRPSGRVVGRNRRKQWDSLMRSSGYNSARPFIVDGLRHTAASMFIQRTQNRALVSEWLGTSPEILRRHYRVPVSAADCERFWAIR